MMRLNQLLSQEILSCLSLDARELIEFEYNKVRINTHDYAGQSNRYSTHIKVLRQILDSLWDKEETSPITYRQYRSTYTQAQVDRVKENPTTPLYWPPDLFNKLHEANMSFVAEKQNPGAIIPTITVIQITSGYSLINAIGNVSTENEGPAFKRLPAAEHLMSQGHAHRHAMLEIGPHQYVYLTNTWDPDTANCLGATSLLLFRDLMSLENQKKMERIVMALYTPDLTNHEILNMISNILVDPEKYRKDLQNALNGIEGDIARQERAGLLTKSGQLRDNIANYEASLAKFWAEMADVQRQLQCTPPDESRNDDLFNFIDKHQDILRAAYDKQTNRLKLYICTALEYYDKDAFIRAMMNPTSKYWDATLIIDIFIVVACFLGDRYDILTRTGVVIDTKRKSVSKCSDTVDNKIIDKLSGILHPHIMTMSCFGENNSKILAGLGNNNYIGTVAQSVAACKNFNTVDSSAIGYLLKSVNGAGNIPFIRDNYTGEILTKTQFNEHHRKKLNALHHTDNAKDDLKKSIKQDKSKIQEIADSFNEREETNE